MGLGFRVAITIIVLELLFLSILLLLSCIFSGREWVKGLFLGSAHSSFGLSCAYLGLCSEGW